MAFELRKDLLAPTALLTVTVLVACGGGGGGGGTGPAPAISYSSNSITFATEYSQVIAPSNSGGAAASWSISPALPPGLVFSTTTGSITAATTATAAAANYKVTAENSGGQSTVTLTIGVVDGLLLDLGHATPVTVLQMSGARALSQEASGRCILWDIVTDAQVATLTCTSSVAMAGPTVVIADKGSLEVFGPSDGHAQGTITTTYTWWHLAADGSYVVAGSTSGLTAWSPTGQLLCTANGDYSKANAFAAAGQTLVANGPQGTSVIETIQIPSGISSIGPAFSGTFMEWFADGSHYQTTLGTTAWTYSSASAQQDIKNFPTPPQLQGLGNWYWGADGGVINIWAVGSSANPTASTPAAGATVVSGPTFAVISSIPQTTMTVADLSGAVPVLTTYPLPFAGVSAYAALSGTNWFVGDSNGVVLDGRTLGATPRYLTLGTAWSVASGGGLVAIATASGTIFVMDPQTKTIQTTIAFANNVQFAPGNMQMSSDGKVLAVSGSDRSIRVFSLPAGTLINTFPNTINGNPVTGFSLAPNGTLIAQVTGNQFSFARQITAITGGPVLWSDTYATEDGVPNIQFSPDSTLIAASTDVGPDPGAATNIYQNFTLTTALPGVAVGWIDNSRLLVNKWVSGGTPSLLYKFVGATIYSSAGTALASTKLPELDRLETVAADSIYVPDENSIYSLTTGALIFGDGRIVGQADYLFAVGGTAIAGLVVFPYGSLVLKVPY
jgi:WD40 repeat protein